MPKFFGHLARGLGDLRRRQRKRLARMQREQPVGIVLGRIIAPACEAYMRRRRDRAPRWCGAYPGSPAPQHVPDMSSEACRAGIAVMPVVSASVSSVRLPVPISISAFGRARSTLIAQRAHEAELDADRARDRPNRRVAWHRARPWRDRAVPCRHDPWGSAPDGANLIRNCDRVLVQAQQIIGAGLAAAQQLLGSAELTLTL